MVFADGRLRIVICNWSTVNQGLRLEADPHLMLCKEWVEVVRKLSGYCAEQTQLVGSSKERNKVAHK